MDILDLIVLARFMYLLVVRVSSLEERNGWILREGEVMKGWSDGVAVIGDEDL